MLGAAALGAQANVAAVAAGASAAAIQAAYDSSSMSVNYIFAHLTSNLDSPTRIYWQSFLHLQWSPKYLCQSWLPSPSVRCVWTIVILLFLLFLAPPTSNQNIDVIQAKLQQANEEKAPGQQDVSTLQQEENVSISGSNARLMIMKKLSRKSEVRVSLCNVCLNTNLSEYRSENTLLDIQLDALVILSISWSVWL